MNRHTFHGYNNHRYGKGYKQKTLYFCQPETLY